MLHNQLHRLALSLFLLSIAWNAYAQQTSHAGKLLIHEANNLEDQFLFSKNAFTLKAEKLDLFQADKPVRHISDIPSAMSTSTNGNFKVKVEGDVGPFANNVYSLGSNTSRWRDVFVGPHSIHIGTGPNNQAVLSHSNTDGLQRLLIDVDNDDINDFYFETGGALSFFGPLQPNQNAGDSSHILQSTGASDAPQWIDVQDIAWSRDGNTGIDTVNEFIGTTDNNDIVFRTDNIIRSRIRNSTGDADEGAFEPYLDNTYSLGTPTHRWKDLYLGPASIRIGGFINGAKGQQNQQTIDEAVISYSDGVVTIDKYIGSTGMVPNNTDVYTLGTSDNRWSDLFLGGNSMHIGSATSEAIVSYDTLNGIFKISSDGDAIPELSITSGGDIYVASLNGGGIVQADPTTGKLVVGGSLAGFESTLTFSNGLTRTANNIALGGALAATTTITTASGNNLIITGGGKVGIGSSTSPNTTLDIGGDMAVRFSSLTLSNGANTAVSVGSASAVRISGPTASFELHGIASGYDGKVLDVYNASGQTMTLMNESSSESTSSNRITTGTGSFLELRNKTSARLIYNGTDNRWIVTSATRNTSNMTWNMKTYSSFGTTNQNGWTPDYGFICHRVSSSGNINMTGINSTNAQDGTVIIIINTGTNTITLQNENSNATSATYRIITGTGNNEQLTGNKPATLVYDATSQRWRVISSR